MKTIVHLALFVLVTVPMRSVASPEAVATATVSGDTVYVELALDDWGTIGAIYNTQITVQYDEEHFDAVSCDLTSWTLGFGEEGCGASSGAISMGGNAYGFPQTPNPDHQVYGTATLVQTSGCGTFNWDTVFGVAIIYGGGSPPLKLTDDSTYNCIGP